MSSYEAVVREGVSGVMGLLMSQSTEELKAALENESRLESLILDSPAVRGLAEERERLLTENKAVAQANLGEEPKLREAKARLLATYDRASSLRAQCLEQKAALDAAGESRSLDTTQALLETAARETEDAAEALAEKLLSAELSPEEFLKEFIPQRSQAHLRRIKADRIGDLLRGQAFPGGSQGDPNPPYPVRPNRRAPQPPSNYTL